MTRSDDLTARVLIVERERDELQRLNFKLRDKLLELAKECTECGGTGVATVVTWASGARVERQVDCKDCADIRESLA